MAIGKGDSIVFNFQVFSSSVPGKTRAHLVEDDSVLPIAFVAFTVSDEPGPLNVFTRVSAELYTGEGFYPARHSASMTWPCDTPILTDEVPVRPVLGFMGEGVKEVA